MQRFETLTDFIRQTDGQFRIFDMGRRVSKLSADTFHKVENGHIPYPLPFLHQAWIGVLLWNPKQQDQNVVWFLKLPLDEQGYLVQAARDDFLARLMENLMNNQGVMDASENTEGFRDALKDNPFSFKPEQEKMAAFHAKATLTTRQPASSYYEHAQAYFTGQTDPEKWDGLGFQGIADFVVRLDQEDNAAALTQQLATLPVTPLEAVCSLLEHAEPDTALTVAISQRLHTALHDKDSSPNLIGALVRGLSNSKDEATKVKILTEVVNSPVAKDPEIIAAVASRCWMTLQHPELLTPFLETLAVNDAGQACFNRVMADLMFIPTLRALSLQAFRSETRSEALGKAIGGLFGESFE
ncbi:DUF3549 family protein [Aliamphritea hakodatensis]|uniref:DUF3549 family protein n=1 Tax=Aliamphritea hakodatensis TaxID=2895352 RepID=UPI0022FD62E0|nr:DUF3549 family protein [Aliamphritea hakodatensis]